MKSLNGADDDALTATNVALADLGSWTEVVGGQRSSLADVALASLSIHDRLVLLLKRRVAASGWTLVRRNAASTLEAMATQLDQIIGLGMTPPRSKQHFCLQHALARGQETVELLQRENAGRL